MGGMPRGRVRGWRHPWQCGKGHTILYADALQAFLKSLVVFRKARRKVEGPWYRLGIAAYADSRKAKSTRL